MLSLVALIAGLALGVAATGSPPLRAVVVAVEPLGALWVNAIRMTIVPLVFSLLVTSVSGMADVALVGRAGVRALMWFLLLLGGAALFTSLVAPPLFDRLAIDPAAAAALRASAAAATPGEVPAMPTLRGFVVGLVPQNPVRAAADGAMLPLIVFTLLFATAVTRLAADARALITKFFRATTDAMLLVVRWILVAAPIGVFALSADLGLQLGAAAVGAVGYYIFVSSALLAVVTLALYPVAMVFARTPLRRFARSAAPAQAVAVSSRSSLASLPALIDGARREYGDRPTVTGFLLPLAVSTFKINIPVLHICGALLLARLYGIDLSPTQIATMAAVTIALSFSTPGVPSSGFFVVTGPVLLSVGMPLDGIAILIAADTIPDVFATVANVTADMTVATVAGRGEEAVAAVEESAVVERKELSIAG